MPTKHAQIAMSSAGKWSLCAAAPRMEQLYPEPANPDGGNWYAAEGTAGHYLAELSLRGDPPRFSTDPDWNGGFVFVGDDGACVLKLSDDKPEDRIGTLIPITIELIEAVDAYLQNLQSYVGTDGVILPENRLDISTLTGEKDAYGTADAIVIRGTELQVHDLKLGRKPANPEQLIGYASAAYGYYALFYDIQTVTWVIHQPRIAHYPTETYTLPELAKHTIRLHTAGHKALKLLDKDEATVLKHAVPGTHCSDSYCKARADCKALAQWVEESVSVSLDDVTTRNTIANETLGALASRVPTIRDWCDQIEARTSALVLSGEKVPGFKPVLGREGNRKWDDETAAETAAAALGLPMTTTHNLTLKTPPQLEKEKKTGKLNDEQWDALAEHITRTPAPVIVVPESDKRQAVDVDPAKATDSDFENLDA